MEQEKASVQICEMQDDGLEKDNKEKIVSKVHNCVHRVEQDEIGVANSNHGVLLEHLLNNKN